MQTPHKIKPIKFVTTDVIAKLRKRNMTSLVTELKSNQKSLSVIEQRLANDKSRTETKALIDSRKEAKRHINKVDKSFLEAQKEKQLIVDGYLQKVAKERQVKGTTDLLILQGYLPLFEKKANIFSLAVIDPEACRAALLLPAVKHKFSLVDKDMMRLIKSLSQHTLGDEYGNLVEAQHDLDTFQTVRDDLFNSYATADDELNQHMQGVVELIPEGATMN